MPSISKETIRNLRKRKKWTQIQLLAKLNLSDMSEDHIVIYDLDDIEYTSANLSKVESGLQNPTELTTKKIMKALDMPVETFFCPYLDNQPMYIYDEMDRINHLLGTEDSDDWEDAAVLVGKLETQEGFETSVNKQFIVSCKAQLNELRDGEPQITIDLAREGLAITYEEFDENKFEGDVLLFEEPNLIHMLALGYHRKGDTDAAQGMLRYICEGLERLPGDAREKEKKLAPILMSISDILMQKDKYSEALDTCRHGRTVSDKRNKGKYTPRFAHKEAVCYFLLGDEVSSKRYFQYAYFGYSLLHKEKKAQAILKEAIEKYNLYFDTYGVENLAFKKFPFKIGHGRSVKCDTIGRLIAELRMDAKMSQDELSKGICSREVLSRIENSETQGKVYYMEAFMQRLGRDINKYYTSFIGPSDFREKQIRDEIISRLADFKYEEAEELLAVLRDKKSYKSKGNLQFIKIAEAEIYASRNGYNNPEYFGMLKSALKITKPGFDEERTDEYRLTYNEIGIIQQLAIHYCESDEMERGCRLFEMLRDSMNFFYKDGKEKVRMYTSLLYNYSKCLGLMGRHLEALDIIDEGEIIELCHDRVNLLPGFAVNLAFNWYGMGKIKESVPYFAMAYYGSCLFGYTEDSQAVQDYVKERILGLNFC